MMMPIANAAHPAIAAII